MLGPDITWYLAVAACLFATGPLGVLLRRSPLIVLLSLEIMLNGGNLALIAFARHSGDASGQVFAIAVMAVAASEVVVGLGLIVAIGTTTGGKLSHEADIPSSFGSPAEIGRLFLTDHLLAFEVTSIVLLAAAVGGVILGHHSRTLEPQANARP